MMTIVALIDFSKDTNRIVEQAQTFARAFQSQVILLHMVPSRPVIVDVGLISPTCSIDPSPEQWQADQAQLLKLRESMTKAGINVRVEQYQEATIESILAESGRLKADLIIMGSHHHSLLYEVFVGSVVHDVLKRATCPVLVVPCDASS